MLRNTAAVDAATAWVFPGQGVQTVGMGRDLWEGSEAARRVFEAADRVAGYALSEVCFAGPEEKLRETEYTQPAILATSLACLAAALESGALDARPAVTAGHSIGEYAALIAAEALSLEQGIAVVQERARLMARCGREQPGTMAAILGLDEAAVREICRAADVDPCTLNEATQIVVGGRIEDVGRAVALARERGARVIELNVSGAFHSRLMRPAVAGMVEALRGVALRAPAVPFVANLTAAAMSDPEAIREELAQQVANPVRWYDSMRTMTASMGVRRVVEFGPGRMVTGMTRRSFPEVELINVSDLKSAGRR